MPTLATPTQLTIRASASDTRTAAEWMLRTLAQAGVPESASSRLDICLAEVLANLLSHAGLQPDRDAIELTLAVPPDAAGKSATLTVRDGGLAFDPTHATPRPRPTSLQDAVPGGLGLVMIRSNADDIQYRRDGAHNHLALTVHWADSDAAG